MADTLTIHLAQRGMMTLPKTLRETYHLQTGDTLTLLDLGGVFLLSPRRSEIDSIADHLAQTLTTQGETLASMLQTLREERERYGRPA